MAERRMFAKSIVLSDAFLDMPMSARCLYFTMGMLADDDGFVGNPKSIMRQCGAGEDDIKILLAKRYVLGFESGIIVIKHWRMNNYLRNDRHKNTTYLEELKTLEIDEKGAYTEQKGECIHSIVYTGKDSIDKNSIDKSKKFTPPTQEEVREYVKEKNLNVDADKFYNYFTVGNWVDSKGQKVKNWKQKLLTWENHTTKNKSEDVLPTYSKTNNQEINEREADELMRLMGKK